MKNSYPRSRGPVEQKNPKPGQNHPHCAHSCFLTSGRPRATFCGYCIAMYKRSFKKVKPTHIKLAE